MTLNPIQKLIEEYGYDTAMRVMARAAGYTDVPPTISQFLNEPYYAKDIIGDGLYPEWRSQLLNIFPTQFYSPYTQVATTGSVGTGKSTLCLGGMAYDLTKTLFLRSPHAKYDLQPSTPLALAFINTTKTLAQSVLTNQFKEWMRESPFFKDQMRKVEKIRGVPLSLLPHNIHIVTGSRAGHGLGRAVFSAMLSELNFQGKAVKDQAQQNYDTIKRRIESRFGRGGLALQPPGRMWLDSSKSDEHGFLEQLIADSRLDERSLVIEKAIWEVLAPAGKVKLCGKTFKVFIGSNSRDPFIPEGPHGTLGIPESFLIDVPIEYQPLFEQDLFGALRDLAGKSVWSAHKFFSRTERVKESLVLDNAYRPGYDKEHIVLDFDDDSRLIDYIDVSKLVDHTPYFLHYDLGLKRDATGIALTRRTGVSVVERQDRETLLISMQEDGLYRTEFATAIVATPGKEVPIFKLKNFMNDLSNGGIKIGGVSTDNFQSSSLRQEAEKLTLSTEYISTDKNRDTYDLYKNTVNERRWLGPIHKVLEREMLNLVDLTEKVDHPENTSSAKVRHSKDITDAIAGSLYHCHHYYKGERAVAAMQNFLRNKKTDQAAKPVSSFRKSLYNDAMANKKKIVK